MRWTVTDCGNLAGLRLAKDHYSHTNSDAQKLGGPGAQIVLVAGDPIAAVWMSTYQRPEFVDHAWPGAWNNTLFRNVGGGLSSELIREAVAATRWAWGDPPPEGMVTFVDAGKVRHKRDPGRCYLRAGFVRDGETKGGLLAFVMRPEAMPEAEPAQGMPLRLWDFAPTSPHAPHDPSRSP